MTVGQFLNYIAYSRVCPSYIHPSRWVGMLKWYEFKSNMELSTKVAEFIKANATAHGGDWTGMLLSAIGNGCPELWELMPDGQSWEFVEVLDLIKIIVS